jgi:TRAP-type mannitol/chloroaromatic compound transport system permease large subunit
VRRTMQTCGMLLWLSFGATAMIGVYNLAGGPAFIRELFTGLDVAPIVIILLMMLILVVLGSVMDWVGICLLTMPIFVPIVRELGYDPVWFGVLFCLNMQISYLTPPFGPAADITLNEIFAALWPFVVLQAGVLALVLWQPDIALWLLRSN